VTQKIQGCVALVTGSNRGLGRTYCEGLLRAGAKKIYAAARDAAKISMNHPTLVPLRLDVTAPDDIGAAVDACADITLLVNNAGVLDNSPMLACAAEAAARHEMETNFFGLLGMIRGFAPVLAKNGGGTIVNVLSVASWFANPFMATYCASKAAAEMLTHAIRMQLRSQGTDVVGVYAGYIDTDMAAHVRHPKTSPEQVVERTFEGVENGQESVFADERAVDVDARVRLERAAFYAELLERWVDAQARNASLIQTMRGVPPGDPSTPTTSKRTT